MNDGAQLTLGFDLAPVAATPMVITYSPAYLARREEADYLRGIAEKVEADLDLGVDRHDAPTPGAWQ